MLLKLRLADRWHKWPDEVDDQDPDLLYYLEVERVYNAARAEVASLQARATAGGMLGGE